MFSGSLVALITPMLDNDEIDYPSLKTLLDFHQQNQTQGIVLCGSTGEGAVLSLEEKISVVTAAVEHLQGSLPIIVGVGTNSTKTSVEQAQVMASLGVDGLLMICPYYNRPTQQGLLLHFEAIAEAVDCPIMIYNHPGRTGVDMLPETAAKLSTLPNIIGIKEAVVDETRFAKLGEIAGEHFLLFSGDDASFTKFMAHGASGVISVAANVVPEKIQQLCQLQTRGENEHVQQLRLELAELFNALNIESNPIPVKWCLSKMGYCQAHLRLPLTIPSPDSQRYLDQILTTHLG